MPQLGCVCLKSRNAKFWTREVVAIFRPLKVWLSRTLYKAALERVSSVLGCVQQVQVARSKTG